MNNEGLTLNAVWIKIKSHLKSGGMDEHNLGVCVN